MLSQFMLETEGYQIIFELKNLDNTKEDENVDVVVEFLLDSRLSNVSVKSIPTFIAIKDFHRLVKYFEQHITCLQQDPDSESYTFVPMELGFQVQALSGEVRSHTEGEFTLRFMINIGRSDETASQTYIGGESVVKLESIQRFISSVRAIRQLAISN